MQVKHAQYNDRKANEQAVIIKHKFIHQSAYQKTHQYNETALFFLKNAIKHYNKRSDEHGQAVEPGSKIVMSVIINIK
ncbi:hypothetical protein CRS_02690 [Chryseobacterium sp. ON_d1]|nr:hypothetical protein CRS_02690 [Chryseobacterium sp. ON_d1]